MSLLFFLLRVGARAAAVHAALEKSKQEADEALQLFSRRANARIGQDPIISPSQSFDTTSTESGGSRTDAPHTFATAVSLFPFPLSGVRQIYVISVPQSVTPPPTLPKSPAVAQRQHQLHIQQHQAHMTPTGADGKGCVCRCIYCTLRSDRAVRIVFLMTLKSFMC